MARDAGLTKIYSTVSFPLDILKVSIRMERTANMSTEWTGWQALGTSVRSLSLGALYRITMLNASGGK